MKPKISCIIPAYNEEKTIAGVVKFCLKTKEINEIIVVNDGSEDKTVAKLSPFAKKIIIIDLKRNKGKGYAVAQGVKKAKYPLILMLDADLLDWEPYHIRSLIKPVIEEKIDMTIGALTTMAAPYNVWWPLSGQRCLWKKDLLPLIDEMEKANYGLEILLDETFKKKRMIVVPLVFKNNPHLGKEKKQKDWMVSYLKEAVEVFQKTMSIRGAGYQKRMKNKLLKRFASYFKVSYRRLKNYLLEEIE